MAFARHQHVETLILIIFPVTICFETGSVAGLVDRPSRSRSLLPNKYQLLRHLSDLPGIFSNILQLPQVQSNIQGVCG